MAVLVGGIMFLAVPLFKSMQKKTDRLNLVFREGLTGVRVIRAFGKANYEEQRFDEANKDYTQTAIKVNTIVALMIPLMTLIMSGTNIAITWFGGHYIAEMQLYDLCYANSDEFHDAIHDFCHGTAGASFC